jgi:hypothetical protein
MAYEHPSGLPNTLDRAQGRSDWQGLAFTGRQFVQSAELNEIQTIERNRSARLGRVIGKDGNRIEGAAAVVQVDLGNVILTAGKILLRGDVFPVAQAVLSGVPMTGDVEIGVRVLTEWITSEDDPTLLGLEPGSRAEGEPGAARERVTISWALATGLEPGDFVPVYAMRDGVIIDQTPPPILEGVNQALAIYDRDAHGSYIVRGCRGGARGAGTGGMAFSIEEGVANINGFKRTRQAAFRHVEPQSWDVGTVDGEAQTHPGGANPVFTVARQPIASVANVLITKEATATITRGATTGGSDLLPDSSVTAIVSVTQGATTFIESTDFVRTGDRVDWFPSGAEPAVGSSYTVTYRYLDSVTPSVVTDTTIQVAGGVAGSTAILAYSYKLPRMDRVCLNQAGTVVYVRGVSAVEDPLPPIVPVDLLSLATVTNTWVGTPVVVNDGVRSVSFAEQWRYYNRLFDMDRLLQLERLKSAVDRREPTAKLGTFVDPLEDDYYRDAGEAQTAAVGMGVIQLAIDPTFFLATLTEPVMLDWVEEVLVRQERYTRCMLINPYSNFLPLPGAMKLTPPADFWATQQTQWLSPQTIELQAGSASSVASIRATANVQIVSRETRIVDQRQEKLETLREIEIDFEIEGFGAGETLDELTFDGVDVLPAGTLTADAAGTLSGSFVIPPGVVAGTKEVIAVGSGGTEASARFVGEGTVNVVVMRRVTTVRRIIRRGAGSGSGPSANPSEHTDPLAQSFAMPEMRQLVGVDLRFCAIGNRANAVLVQQVSMDVGLPTTEVEAEAFVDMNATVVNSWTQTRYPMPVLTGVEAEHAFVVKTDDAQHALSIARLGDFDAASDSYVAAQPYSVGVMFSSSNGVTWTPHQEDDMTFRLVAASYPVTTKTVNLGTFNLVNCSDLQVRAAVELPSSDCSVVFEIVRPGGGIWRLPPYQLLRLNEYVTETVQLRAVLTGTERLSPTLFAPVLLVAGTIRTSGTYISRAFDLGSDVRLTAYFKAALPAGSSVTAEYDLADDTWVTIPLASVEALADPAWVEQKREVTSITGTSGRIRLTLAGGPGARPEIADLSAAVM